jgi:zinc protease
MHRVLLPLVVMLVLLSGCRPVQVPPGATPVAADVSKPAVDLAEPLPVDPDVRIGTLDNGLTYYIRENQEPQERAELWLAVNAGSVL